MYFYDLTNTILLFFNILDFFDTYTITKIYHIKHGQ